MIQRRATITRERALEGAAAVFARHGYAGATLSDITAEAGVSKGALYFHFSSKEEIARAILDVEQRAAKESVEAIMAAASSPLEAAMAICADFARLVRDDIVLRAGVRLTSDATSFDPPVKSVFDDWIPLIAGLLEAGMAAGEVRTDHDAATLGHFVIPAFTGVQLVSGALTGYADLIVRLREMWLILLPVLVTDSHADAVRAAVDRILPAEA